MKRLTALLVVAGVCAAFAVPALAATNTVDVGPKFRFGTKSLSIRKGDTVRFRWVGKLPHNVRIASGPVRGTISGVRKKGTVSKRFTRAGRYTIVCDIHQGMKLALRVS
jgi:plastocyanin